MTPAQERPQAAEGQRCLPGLGGFVCSNSCNIPEALTSSQRCTVTFSGFCSIIVSLCG